MQPFNYRWVAQGQHAVTTQWYPVATSQPPGYTAVAGVAAGTRVWLHVPQSRFQGGHQGTDYVTITGMAQNIIVGAAVTGYPVAAGYQFATGLAPAAAVPGPHGFEHATTGADVVNFPAAPLAFPTGNNFRHTFTLTTPVPVPKTELVLFVEYTGGEYRESATNGQTISSDWKGAGTGARGVTYAGFSVGASPRAITQYGSDQWLPQICVIIDEPVLAATGFHANDYHSPPLGSEDYLSIGGGFPDYASSNTPNSTLFFNIRGGQRFANGQAIVMTDFAPFSFPAAIPTAFGNLLINPASPMLSILTGNTFSLDNMGNYEQGPANPLSMPQLAPATIGAVLKFQSVLVDASFGAIQLSSASSMLIN